MKLKSITVSHPYENWRAAIDFAIEETNDGIEFLNCWNQGEWAELDMFWPDWKDFVRRHK